MRCIDRDQVVTPGLLGSHHPHWGTTFVPQRDLPEQNVSLILGSNAPLKRYQRDHRNPQHGCSSHNPHHVSVLAITSLYYNLVMAPSTHELYRINFQYNTSWNTEPHSYLVDVIIYHNSSKNLSTFEVCELLYDAITTAQNSFMTTTDVRSVFEILYRWGQWARTPASNKFHEVLPCFCRKPLYLRIVEKIGKFLCRYRFNYLIYKYIFIIFTYQKIDSTIT